jgi:hypothetical protein
MRKIVTGLVFSALVMGTSALAFADNSNDYGVTPGPNDTFTAGPNDNVQQPGTVGNGSAPSYNNGVNNNNNSGWGNSDNSNVPSNNNAYNSQQPGTAVNNANSNDRYSDTGMTSTANNADMKAGFLSNNKVSMQPQVGVMAFKDALGNNTSRAALGLTVDANLASIISPSAGNLFFGPATGVIYSHLGSATSNFVGTNPDVSLSDQANFLLIPANLKLGVALGDNFRVSARGGGNLTYRSIGSSTNFGPSSGTDSSVWRIFPNVGADVEIGFGRNVSLMLRPDYTFTPGDNFFTGTVGLGINLG